MQKSAEAGGNGHLCRGDGARQAVSHLRAEFHAGKHWYLALLEAVSLWDLEEEHYQGRYFRYLIGGEAFDWFLLAERLLKEMEEAIPREETERFLFYGQLPLQLNEEELRRLMGYAKYRAYLNYLYGVTVEEALVLAVEGEVRKERRGRACKEDQDLEEEVYGRVYGRPHSHLLEEFCRERGQVLEGRLPLFLMKEFTYWLFKYRLNNSQKVRIASDTKKGLDELIRQRELVWRDLAERTRSTNTPG